jgi:DNA invertase Pin-like site-specific DNA recombinase
MPTAYSYVRFSTPEQSKGDSLRRQQALSEAYALENGLTLDTTLTFHDLGVSAYRGVDKR